MFSVWIPPQGFDPWTHGLIVQTWCFSKPHEGIFTTPCKTSGCGISPERFATYDDFFHRPYRTISHRSHVSKTGTSTRVQTVSPLPESPPTRPSLENPNYNSCEYLTSCTSAFLSSLSARILLHYSLLPCPIFAGHIRLRIVNTVLFVVSAKNLCLTKYFWNFSHFSVDINQ